MVAINHSAQEATRQIFVRKPARLMPRTRHTARRMARAVLAAAVMLGAGLLDRTGAKAENAAPSSTSAVILLYHRFGEDAHPTTNTTRDQLAAHIEELTNGPFVIMPLSDVASALKADLPIPERTIAITIDDAYASVFNVARPLFKEHRMPYAVFVSTDPVDQGAPGYMTWDQLRILRDEGVTIGHHTANHLRMVDASEEEIRSEIARASARFEAELGFVPTLFAYPYGDFGARERALVVKAGFDAAFGQFSSVAGAQGDQFALPRFALNEQYGDLDRLRLIINALPLPVKNVEPDDPMVTSNPPDVSFRPSEGFDSLSGLSCYPSHLGAAAPIERDPDGRARIVIDQPFPAGRSRVNCTAQGDDGRWRWLGIPIYVKSEAVRDKAASSHSEQSD